MKKIFQKIKTFLRRTWEKKLFENKIFSIITIAGIIIFLLSLLANFFFNNYVLINLITGLSGVALSVFFYLSFFRGITKPLSLPFQIIVAFALAISWFYFQGIEGVIPLFFFPAMFFLIYNNSGKKFWPILLGIIALAIVLTGIQFLFPELFVANVDKNLRINYFSISFIVTLFVMGLATIILKKNFDQERKKTAQKNKELKLSEGRFRDIAMSSGDWIWEVDENSVYTYCSEKVEEILGYTPAEMIGKTPFDFMPDDEVEAVLEESRQIVSKRQAFKNWENWNLTKAGQRICVITSGVPVLDDLGNLIGYRGTDTDITRRKQAENTIQENLARLDELNATKDKFFSIISHDLKNPFNAIIGFSNILAEQVKEKNYEGILKYAEIIQNSSQRAMDLLLNLLGWSRLQTGTIEFKPENIEIAVLINEAFDLFKDAAQQKSIIISKKIPQNIHVFADGAMISSVLRNLISNAVKFTDAGGEIVVSAEQNQDELKIAVSDSGVGIKKEDLNKLFRIEENLSTEGTQKEKGTGLGLILCKEFIEKHGGKIWVESNSCSDQESPGCKFFFSIPNS